jgi:hypothetical protein
MAPPQHLRCSPDVTALRACLTRPSHGTKRNRPRHGRRRVSPLSGQLRHGMAALAAVRAARAALAALAALIALAAARGDHDAAVP